ncbi:MAG: hypothetical protein Q7U38_12210, partial [Methylobacter sp.]|nr:hypothetical protein [Methylobacter sp.]
KWQDKQQQLEERNTLLKAAYEQSIEAQRTVQRQNQQLLAEATQLRAMLEKVTSPVLQAHRFKRHRTQR